MDFLIEKVIDAVLEASGVKDKVNRDERMIRLLKRFGLDDSEGLSKFEDVYAYAVVQYAFDAEGGRKPDALVQFFKLKVVRELFRSAYG